MEEGHAAGFSPNPKGLLALLPEHCQRGQKRVPVKPYWVKLSQPMCYLKPLNLFVIPLNLRAQRNPLKCAIVSCISSLIRLLLLGFSSDPSDLVPCSAVLDLFEPVSLMALEDVVGQIKPSGSPYDTVPLHFIKEIFPSIGQSVLAIIKAVCLLVLSPKFLNMLWCNPKLSMLSWSRSWMSMISWRSSSLV